MTERWEVCGGEWCWRLRGRGEGGVRVVNLTSDLQTRLSLVDQLLELPLMFDLILSLLGRSFSKDEPCPLLSAVVYVVIFFWW